MTIANALNLQLNGSTGTGNFVGATSPTIVTPTLTSPTMTNPILGTPTSGTLTNCTGLPVSSLSGLGAGVETWLATPSSANLQATVTGETGSGALVFGTAPTINSPVLVTPTLGAANATTLSISTTAGLTINSLKPVMTVKQQVFLSSGTYTPSTGMLYCIVECVGGGGGSGGCGTTAGGQVAIGGGGGGGSYSASLLSAATIGVSQTVTIGAGGTAGTIGANAGGAGGTTSLGSLVIAPGGNGGAGDAATATPSFGGTPGSGGTAGTGAIFKEGGNGQFGWALNSSTQIIPSAGGGSNFYGFSPSVTLVGASQPGDPNSGKGATGGAIGAATTQIAGAVGGSGIVIITEFCNQ